MGDIRHEIGDAGNSFMPRGGPVVPMRTLLLTVMMLCACLFTPGCTGENEVVICDVDEEVLTQYDSIYCEFEVIETPEGEECGGPDGDLYIENECYGPVKIEMTNTGDSPIRIITFSAVDLDRFMNCESIWAFPETSVFDSMGANLEGPLPGAGSFIVAFDHPNSCDEEDASTPTAEISFKVSLVT